MHRQKEFQSADAHSAILYLLFVSKNKLSSSRKWLPSSASDKRREFLAVGRVICLSPSLGAFLLNGHTVTRKAEDAPPLNSLH